METIFYDELELDKESPVTRTLGAPVLEEEEVLDTYIMHDPTSTMQLKR